jgi:branched-subunit amino acid transport protein AzlD
VRSIPISESEDVLDHLDHLLPVDLLMTFNVSILDKPAFKLRVAPGAPDRIGEAVVIMFHVLGEGCALSVVGGGDDMVCDEPFTLDRWIMLE